ncbi:MAG: hypothetical protein KAG82_12950 [Alcanivoracaceae bacterium]|nr:hypothetical protein [Alcanivoracaceae bacterium]
MTPTSADPSSALRLSRILGSGNERLCWEHPFDSSMCVKTVRPGVTGRGQNDLDFHYYQLLRARGIGGPRIPAVAGWVETDQGRGLLVERVSGPDGASPMSVSRALQEGRLSPDQAVKLIDEAFTWFIAHSVVVSDCNPEHLVLRQDSTGKDILAVVDGLGGRHRDFRYRLRNLFPWYARRKSRKTRREIMRMVFPSQ